MRLWHCGAGIRRLPDEQRSALLDDVRSVLGSSGFRLEGAGPRGEAWAASSGVLESLSSHMPWGMLLGEFEEASSRAVAYAKAAHATEEECLQGCASVPWGVDCAQRHSPARLSASNLPRSLHPPPHPSGACVARRLARRLGIISSVTVSFPPRPPLAFGDVRFEPQWAKTITGLEEGVYGWVAINYLKGAFQAAERGPASGAGAAGGQATAVHSVSLGRHGGGKKHGAGVVAMGTGRGAAAGGKGGGAGAAVQVSERAGTAEPSTYGSLDLGGSSLEVGMWAWGMRVHGAWWVSAAPQHSTARQGLLCIRPGTGPGRLRWVCLCESCERGRLLVCWTKGLSDWVPSQAGSRPSSFG